MSKSAFVQKLEQLTNFIILATVFLLPLFFIPTIANLFDLSKNLLLAVSTSILLILWMLKNIFEGKFRLTITPLTLPLILFTIVSLISSWSGSFSTIAAFITTTSTITFLSIFFLVTTSTSSSTHLTNHMLRAIVASGAFLAVAAILEVVGFGPTRWIDLLSRTTPNNNLFISPVGSATILITYLLPTLLIALFLAITQKHTLEKAAYFISSAIITAALVIAIFNVLPGKVNSPNLLPISTSWQIAIENIKHFKSFLIGVGPQHYMAAFTGFKPASFNQSPLWSVRFSQSSNYPLHVLTTTGILGLLCWSWLLFKLAKLLLQYSSLTNPARIGLLTTALIFIITLFIPNNLPLLSLFIFLLALVGLELKHQHHPSAGEMVLKFLARRFRTNHNNPLVIRKSRELLPFLIGVPCILLSCVFIYGSSRIVRADYYYRQSLLAANNNDGTATYNNQNIAIVYNPFSATYRKAYTNTNLALANALSKKGNLSDQDKNTITALIQQAIREGRNGVILDPQDPSGWETLALVYRSLINTVTGAKDWTITSYVQAIRRDPTNPLLRLDLGGVYYQLEDYQNAGRFFEQSAALKPNYANAHYNLAAVYKQANQLEMAVKEYDLVLQILDPTSTDYTKALEEQSALKARLGEKPTKAASQLTTKELTTPSPLPSPTTSKEQINLDQNESAPPVTSDQPRSTFGDIVGSPSASPRP